MKFLLSNNIFQVQIYIHIYVVYFKYNCIGTGMVIPEMHISAHNRIFPACTCRSENDNHFIILPHCRQTDMMPHSFTTFSQQKSHKGATSANFNAFGFIDPTNRVNALPLGYSSG